ncbi:MAG: AMP-binding protein, partial [Acidobacteriaceae bacterium]
MSETIASGFQLSPQQKHLWLRGAEEFAFNSIVAFLLEGKLDAEALKRSLQEVIARHEILRTTFERRPGMKVPVQIVNENLAPLWAQSDIRSLPADRQRSHVDQVVRQEQGSHFDLVRGPIIRAMLVMLASERHVLVLNTPALSADVATLRNLVSEIGQHTSTASDEEAFQYADFSAWQNELLQREDDDSKAGKQFWNSLLADTVLAVRLPFELNPVESKGFQAESIAIPVPAEASRESTSFFAACWQVLQWRLTGQSKIVVGDVCDGRNHEEVAGAMGLFTRSLPIPFAFDGGSNFETVKAELEKIKSAAYDQQDHLPIDASSQDLQISFLAEDVPSKYQAGGLSFSLLEQESASQRYRMQLRCVRNGAVSALEIRYDPKYFSRSATEHIGECLSVLMKSAAQDPTSAIADLAIIRDAERQKVLQEFNRTITDFPNAQCIHYIFEAQAARVPDQPALRFGETFLTYTELNVRSNQLAHMLRRNGVKADVAVGLCLDRSADMIVALLGIMKAGGAYVPLIPDNPKARLAHQLSEIKSPVLITEEKYLTRLPEFSGQIVCLDGDHDLLVKEPVNNPEHINTAQNTVYIIYTSGSTGLPKGVAVSHSNLVNYAQSISQKLNAEADSLSFATVSTLAADLGNTAIFPSLISGGCLHVIAYETGMAGNLFSEYVKRYPLDVLKITPSHLSSLLASTEGGCALPRKYLVLGGETASWDLVRRVQQAGKCAVINHYGPTEATVGCCTFSV